MIMMGLFVTPIFAHSHLLVTPSAFEPLGLSIGKACIDILFLKPSSWVTLGFIIWYQNLILNDNPQGEGEIGNVETYCK